MYGTTHEKSTFLGIELRNLGIKTETISRAIFVILCQMNFEANLTLCEQDKGLKISYRLYETSERSGYEENLT